MSEPLRIRIVGFERVPAATLVPHPENWRTHPDRQRRALAGLLDKVGIADAVVARRLPDGALQLLDGHLRASAIVDVDPASRPLVPVVIVDLDDDEARKFLLTADPISTLAESDDAMLRDLLASLPQFDPAMFAGLQETTGVDPSAPPAPLRAVTGTSTVKLVQLFFTEEQHGKFLACCSALAEVFQTATITDTVMEAVRDAEAQVLLG